MIRFGKGSLECRMFYIFAPQFALAAPYFNKRPHANSDRRVFITRSIFQCQCWVQNNKSLRFVCLRLYFLIINKMKKQILFIERLLIECRQSQTKVGTHANHKAIQRTNQTSM